MPRGAPGSHGLGGAVIATEPPVDRVGWVRASDLAGQVFCEYRVHLERVIGQRRPRRGRAEVEGLLASLGVRRVELRGVVAGVPLVAMPYAVKGDEGLLLLRVRIGTPKVRFDDRVYLSAVRVLAVQAMQSRGELGLGVVAARTPAGLVRGLAVLREGRLGGSGGDWIASRVFIDEDDALRALEPLLAYWRGSRPPRPAVNPRICEVCEFRDSCPYSGRSG